MSGRDFDDDFADGLPDSREDSGGARRQRGGGVRFRFNDRPLRLPKTLWGRIFSGVVLVVFVAAVVLVLLGVRSFFLRDSRFVVESSSAIQSTGNAHVTRAQLLSIFGEDVERNIFTIPLAERRAELERLPWVEHATVMRLLPNHIRIAITERTPVAFVRQGSQIVMVDASGVLLDMPTESANGTEPVSQYSFPVVSGVGVNDPLSTRAARMKIFGQFTSDLDSGGDRLSQKLSEVDLSDPEDVKAVIPEGGGDVLVHFGDTAFLDRYRKFEQHLAEWRTQYPKLASVDMRYARQVVLDMQPGAGTAAAGARAVGPSDTATKAAARPADRSAVPQAAPKPAPKPASKPVSKPINKVAPKALAAKPLVAGPLAIKYTAAAPSAPEQWHMVVVKPRRTTAVTATKKTVRPTHPAQAAHPPLAAHP